jgi:integrase
VPQDLIPHYRPRKELAHSLETSDYRAACEKARVEYVRLDQEFSEVRAKRQAEVRASITEAEMDRLVLMLEHSMLKADEDMRQRGLDDFLFDRMDREHEERLALFRRALARGDVSVAASAVEDWLLGHGFDLNRNSEDFKALGYRFLKTIVTATDRQAKRHLGEVVDTPPDPGPLGTPTQAPASKHGEMTLSGLFEKWKDEKQRTLPEATVTDYATHVRHFQELHGDLPLSGIAKAHVREFKDAMLKCPAINRLPKQYRGKKLPALIKLAEKDTSLPRLSERTINEKCLAALAAVLNWGVKNGYLEHNPATGIKVDVGKVKEKKRLPYSVEDLNLIFRFPIFTEGARPRGGAGEAAKWLPILALFTGARLQELGRLQVEDVRTDRGITYLDLTSAGTKTTSSKRRVPIHKELVRLGFLAYVEERRTAKGGPLFPALKSERSSPTEGWTSWWGRYCRANGITDPRKVFHSFRHTVKDGLRDSGVPFDIRSILQGHTVPGVGEGYGQGFALHVLAEAMDKLHYPGLDLEHLVPKP